MTAALSLALCKVYGDGRGGGVAQIGTKQDEEVVRGEGGKLGGSVHACLRECMSGCLGG